MVDFFQVDFFQLLIIQAAGILHVMKMWHACKSIEQNPEKLGGAYVFQGTRVPVRALFENLEDGATGRRVFAVVSRSHSPSS